MNTPYILTIEVTEISPGVVSTKFYGKGVAGPAVCRTVKHLVSNLETAMQSLPDKGELSGGGMVRITPIK